MNVLDVLWRAIFPRYCVGCRAEGELLCSSCAHGWRPEPPHVLWHEGAGEVTIFPYTDPLARELLCAWKYQYDWSAWKILETKIDEQRVALLSAFPANHFSAIVPMPLSALRFRQRGFNQADTLVQYFSKLLAKPVAHLLRRRHRFGHQADKATPEQRHQAMARTPFFLAPKIIVPRSVLLVDDVLTTGATRQAATRVLREAGVERVDFLAILRG